MYATMIQCDLGVLADADDRGRAARALTTALAALPDFVAVVAIETDAEAGGFTAVYLVEERAGLAEGERVIAQWQGEQAAMAGRGVGRLGAGEVIAQRGL